MLRQQGTERQPCSGWFLHGTYRDVCECLLGVWPVDLLTEEGSNPRHNPVCDEEQVLVFLGDSKGSWQCLETPEWNILRGGQQVQKCPPISWALGKMQIPDLGSLRHLLTSQPTQQPFSAQPLPALCGTSTSRQHYTAPLASTCPTFRAAAQGRHETYSKEF